MTIESEDFILKILDEFFPRENKALVLGRGDDCAELAPSSGLALSTDLFIEDIHFRRSYFFPEEIGHKALAVNISDLAAAGARPLAFSLGLICPPSIDESYLRGVFSGMSALAGRYNLALAGGDISSGDKLGFCVTIWGEHARAGASFLRRKGEVGDVIFVAGPAGEYSALGLARRGLIKFEERGRAALADYTSSCKALLLPQPQVEAGLLLAGFAHEHEGKIGLMDLSDGLSRDLPRLLGGLGADLKLDPARQHPELGKSALECMLSGGDDYLLLGTMPEPLAHKASKMLLEAGVCMDIIGHVQLRKGIFLQGKPLREILKYSAFDHFEGRQ